jgi:uncharacterized membrane protein YqjE
MVPSRHTDDQESWSDLVAGIVTDAAQLFRKEIELAKIEIRNDLRKLKSLLTGIVIGAIFVVLGISILCVALALALFAYTTLPQWVCFGVVGAVMLVAGLCFIAAVSRKKNFDLIPQRTVEAVKEDVGWITSTIRTSNAISKTANKFARR